jgi:hypothetical protein
MPVRPPSELKQLNDGISYPIVGTLNVRVDDIYGLFDPTSGIREYKNLDEILARLFVSGTGGGGSGSGVTLRSNNIPLGTFGTVNFSGVDVTVVGSGDIATVTIDPSIKIQNDGIALGRAKSINFSGVGFTVQLVGGVATVFSTSSGSGGIAGIIVQDEGISLGQYSKLNFSGAGVIALPDGDKVTIVVQPPSENGSNAFAWHVANVKFAGI